MPTVQVYNIKKEPLAKMELDDLVFASEVNENLLYEVVKAQLASKRQGSANSKGRAEVRGSTRKLYKQKGTGRARHGSIRAPIFVGGGKAHGPKPRQYQYRPNKKTRMGALRSALSHKFHEGRLIVLDQIAIEEIKTKAVAGILFNFGISTSSLIVDGVENRKLSLSTRNLAKHQFLPPEGVNVYDLLRYDYLVVTRDAVDALTTRCRRTSK